MAHKKAAGTAKNLRDSAGQRLGIKLFGGQTVKSGNIICRQRGTKWRSGTGTALGVDHTIYAIRDGVVAFQEKKRVRYDGRSYKYTYIEVIDAPQTNAPKKEGVKTEKKAEAQEVTLKETPKKAPAKKTVKATAEKKPAKKAPAKKKVSE